MSSSARRKIVETHTEIADLRSANADLKRQLEESTNLAKRCSDWGEERRQSALDACEMAMQRKDENEALRAQLTESQARESQLREALTEIDNWLVCACIATAEDMAQSFPHMEEVASGALALPHDDTALREYRDAVIEECVTFLAKAKGQTRNHLLRQGLAFAVEELPELKSVVESTSKGDLNVI